MPEHQINPFEAELQRRAGAAAPPQPADRPAAGPTVPNPFEAELDRRGLIFPSAEGLPEFGTSLGLMISDPKTPREAKDRLLGLRTAVNVPRTVPGKLNAILAQSPDAKVEFAEDGTPIVELGGDRFIINREGFSAQDFRDFLPDLALGGLGAGGGAAAGKLVAGAFGRIAGASLGGGASVVARDELGRAVGSQEETDPRLVAMVAGLSGAGEFIAPKLAKFVGRLFGNRGFVTAGGELTKKGRAAITKAGLDPDDVTPEFIATFKNLADENPVAAARLAETRALGQQLDTPSVPLARGDATRDPGQQAFESAIERGAKIEGVSQEAGQAFRQFRQGQQEALGATAGAVQRRLGTETGEAFGATQAALGAERAALKGNVNDAFDTARSLRASLGADTVKTVGQGVARNFRQQFNPATAPKAAAVIGQLEKFQARFPGRVTTVSVRTMENWRQQMSQLARSADPVERAAAGQALRQYDDLVGKAVDDGLVRGDVEAVQAWGNARRLRKQLFDQFESDKLVAKIVQEQDGALKLTPTEAANVLFTANALGGKQGSFKAIEKIANIVGRDSEAWRALKQEAVLRLFNPATRGTVLDEGLARTFSGDKFATSLEKVMQVSPELMRELFSKSEIQLLGQLRRVALIATNRVPGAVNTSNTATVASILDKMGFLGKLGRDGITTAFRGFNRTATTRRIEDAINVPLPPRPAALPPGIGGGASAGPAATGSNQFLNQ